MTTFRILHFEHHCLQPLVDDRQLADNALLQTTSVAAGTVTALRPTTTTGCSSASGDERAAASEPDEPLLSNAFGNSPCKYG